jgi:hypothetical protein
MTVEVNREPPDLVREMRGRSERKDERLRLLKHRLARLRGKLTREARKLAPVCRDCGKGNIRVKVSQHLVGPGKVVFGPGGRPPSFARHIDFLYCEGCGWTMFNSKVAALATILSEIAAEEGKLVEAKSHLF